MSSTALDKFEKGQPFVLDPAEGWQVLANRKNDKLEATLYTLGELALAETPAKVHVEHENGITLDREGPLVEVAPVTTTRWFLSPKKKPA